MIQPGPEIEHRRNERKVAEGIVKRIYHKLMLIVIKHSPEQVLHTHALPIYLGVLLAVRCPGRGVNLPSKGALTAVKGRVVFVG